MSRTPVVLTVSAAAVLALGAWGIAHWHGQQAAQRGAQTAEAAAQDSPPAAASAAADPQSGAAQADPAPGASQTQTAASGAQASDAGSDPSLQHLAAVPESAALPASSEWKPGVNYDVISPAQPTTVAPGKVEVLEVFWLACPHCYALEPFIRQWEKTKPSYVDVVRVPIMWGPVHRADARLYYTLEALGREDLVDKAFAYIHGVETQTGTESVLFSNDKQETFKQQQSWAVQNGIKADAFAQAYNSFFVNTQLQQAQQTMNAYEVQEVPFIAVDGKFSTSVEKAGSPNKLISLINFLAAWEHAHKQG